MNELKTIQMKELLQKRDDIINFTVNQVNLYHSVFINRCMKEKQYPSKCMIVRWCFEIKRFEVIWSTLYITRFVLFLCSWSWNGRIQRKKLTVSESFRDSESGITDQDYVRYHRDGNRKWLCNSPWKWGHPKFKEVCIEHDNFDQILSTEDYLRYPLPQLACHGLLTNFLLHVWKTNLSTPTD